MLVLTVVTLPDLSVATTFSVEARPLKLAAFTRVYPAAVSVT